MFACGECCSSLVINFAKFVSSVLFDAAEDQSLCNTREKITKNNFSSENIWFFNVS